MVLWDQDLSTEGIKEFRLWWSGFLIVFLVEFACKFSGLILYQTRQKCTYISDFFSNLLDLRTVNSSPFALMRGEAFVEGMG
jgi:hypothetical protein